ncbi:hypothetical protein F66182_4153 [Fusarium sp. NRRL 66182]|nr:hypothetical protein F66182_4153 [Fusarium sp. NRRL 66182]
MAFRNHQSKQGSISDAAPAEPVQTLAQVLPESGRPWWKQSSLVRLNLILLVPLFSSATVGYDGAMMNAQQVMPPWKSHFGNPLSERLGLVNAIFYVGKVVGLLAVTPLSDRIGRRRPILIGIVLCVIGTVIQSAAVNYGMLVFSRWLLGAATAFMSQPSPLLIAELAYPPHRGKITSLYQTFYYFGAILSAWASFGTVKLTSNWAWRIPCILQAFFPLLQLSFFFFVPESPRWLVAQERVQAARDILVRYHGHGDPDSTLVHFELNEILVSLRSEKQNRSGALWKELFTVPSNRKRSAIAISVGFFSQWCGNGVVSYYLTLVLDNIGITNPTHQSLINGLLQVFNFFISVFLGAMMVDRLGRRVLFLWSAAGMMVAYIVWTALSASFLSTHSTAIGIAVIPIIFVYYFHYDIAFTPLLYSYPTEIFPYRLRSTGLGLTLFSSFLALIFNLFVNPIAMASIGWKYYILYCCMNAFILVVVYFLYPETKGYSLEEIAQVFGDAPTDHESSKLGLELDAKGQQPLDKHEHLEFKA